jgi:hypothetical protein
MIGPDRDRAWMYHWAWPLHKKLRLEPGKKARIIESIGFVITPDPAQPHKKGPIRT